jgi:hypothetical protein
VAVLALGAAGPLVADVRAALQQSMKLYADLLAYHQLYFLRHPVAPPLLAFCEEHVRAAVDQRTPHHTTQTETERVCVCMWAGVSLCVCVSVRVASACLCVCG